MAANTERLELEKLQAGTRMVLRLLALGKTNDQILNALSYAGFIMSEERIKELRKYNVLSLVDEEPKLFEEAEKRERADDPTFEGVKVEDVLDPDGLSGTTPAELTPDDMDLMGAEAVAVLRQVARGYIQMPMVDQWGRIVPGKFTCCPVSVKERISAAKELANRSTKTAQTEFRRVYNVGGGALTNLDIDAIKKTYQAAILESAAQTEALEQVEDSVDIKTPLSLPESEAQPLQGE